MVFFIIFIVILVVMGVIGYKKINQALNEAEEGGSATETSVATSNKGSKTAQDFLQFEDIKDNVIDLGNDRYRMVVEVSSINYHLKTEGEKLTIDMAFQKFLNALSFPITIFCQTKIIDDDKMLLQLKEDIIESTEKFPGLSEYGQIYYAEMQMIHVYTGNNKTKKKYIIVPFEDLDELTEFSKEEKYEEATKRIYERAQQIVDLLAPIDLKGEILNTNELIQLVYSAYNKDDVANAEIIASGEYIEPIVTGDNVLNKVDNLEMTDFILFEAQNEIKNKILSKKITDEELKVYSTIVDHLGEVRDNLDNFR